ncbi:MAG: alpha/beta hydrolase [Myxococcaceae bacterium]|nr:alpha/beta hydrolase [Myxococcaceae bacterium]
MTATRRANALVHGLEKLEHKLARTLLEWVIKVPTALLSRFGQKLDGERLHPEIQLLLALRERMGDTMLAHGSVERSRQRMRRDARVHQGVPIPVGAVHDLTFPGAVGALRARHYVPAGANVGQPRPLLVFFHGGGFVLGDLDTHDLPCRALCRELDVHVLSAEYRLAPEHPFPAGVEDARAALRFAQAHAAKLGADPGRVGVAGDSAGANLATVATQLAVQTGEPVPVLQLLIYPAVDSTKDWPSIDLFADGFLLTRADVHWFRKLYFGSFADLADPRASPLLAKDLSGMPPTVIVTAGFDPLRDEGEAYAAALAQAGVRTTLHRVPDLVHGFINLGAVSGAAKQALKQVAELTRELL